MVVSSSPTVATTVLSATALIVFLVSLAVVVIKCACCRRHSAKKYAGQEEVPKDSNSAPVPPLPPVLAKVNKRGNSRREASLRQKSIITNIHSKAKYQRGGRVSTMADDQKQKVAVSKREVSPVERSQIDSVIHGRSHPTFKYPPSTKVDIVALLEEIEHTPPNQQLPPRAVVSLAPPSIEPQQFEPLSVDLPNQLEYILQDKDFAAAPSPNPSPAPEQKSRSSSFIMRSTSKAGRQVSKSPAKSASAKRPPGRSVVKSVESISPPKSVTTALSIASASARSVKNNAKK